MMKKSHWITLALISALLLSILFTSFASARRPQVKTYTVDWNTNALDDNIGNGICHTSDGKCTLYAAIQEANADGENTTITFSKKFQDTNSFVGCALPAITEDYTTVDASSQWDSSNGRPGVEIGGINCTLLNIQANHTKVLGLLFSGINAIGVYMSSGGYNEIGGDQAGQRNVFVTGDAGVSITDSYHNTIAKNYFGTIDGESVMGGITYHRGIEAVSGGWTTIADNLIVGQTDTGMIILTNNNTVRDNIIGVSKNQNIALPNAMGIQIGSCSDNTIGPNNVIAGNTSHGLYLHLADDNDITHNVIGVSLYGVGNGGDGINLYGSDNIRITDNNVIIQNSGNGIYADGASGITIQGNYIDSNDQKGIYFSGITNSQIGGVGDVLRNTIGNNQSDGIKLAASSSVTVIGNHIGLEGLPAGNQGYGIYVVNGSAGNVIGGIYAGEGNWIGWNHLGGIQLEGINTQNNNVYGNVLGAAVTWGFEAPNNNHGIGIYDGAHDNMVGGGNIILASGWTGIAIVNSNDNWLMTNKIGTDGMGHNWGNSYYGVSVIGSGNFIMVNEIANNGTAGGIDSAQAGVWVDQIGSINNLISGNSIYENDGPGIKLTNGANHNLAAPVITTASCEAAQGTACANCSVEIYSDDDNEGRVYEGTTSAGVGGAYTWSGALHGPNITVLAIGPTGSYDTSPFSVPFYVGTCFPHHIYLPVIRR
jgi:parallel beta-helix repeat protein